MTAEEEAIKQHLAKPRPAFQACGCMGSAPGMPACPCEMMWYESVDDAWYQIKEDRLPTGVVFTAIKVLLG